MFICLHTLCDESSQFGKLHLCKLFSVRSQINKSTVFIRLIVSNYLILALDMEDTHYVRNTINMKSEYVFGGGQSLGSCRVFHSSVEN